MLTKKSPQKICIVGGVAGGASAAARLRRLDEHAEILLFERGEYISFANCGLPYHISGTIKERNKLILQTPESFKNNLNVDVKVGHEVIDINRKQKTIQIKKLSDDSIIEESYDKLVLSPGAYPFVPPIKGQENKIFMTLRNIPDLDRIMVHIQNNNIKNAVVIGGGFISVELAENLREIDINTHLIELTPQVFNQFDQDMAEILHKEMNANQVNLYLGEQVSEILSDNQTKVLLKSGKVIDADIIISAIGVRPETFLAEKCGLKIGSSRGIKVNDSMQTSDPNIYAVGDVIEVEHFIDDSKVVIPLAGPANRQGRIAANHICGLNSTYKKTQGTSIAKVFNLHAGCTGINEKQAKNQNLNYSVIHTHPNDHVTYYPGYTPISMKFIYDSNNGKILGMQAIGKKGVDKRVDVLSTAIRAGMTVHDLEDLELAYAPPFNGAKDPINMFGFIATNHMSGLLKSVTPTQATKLDNPVYLDVRSPKEFEAGHIPDAINIPLYELRNRLDEIPKDRPIVINCRVGVRSFKGYRALVQRGFDEVYNLSGGYLTYLNYRGT